MGYEDAPSTKMIATNCVICARPLRDVVSVERGMGPDCAKKHGVLEAQSVPDWEAARHWAKSGGRFDPDEKAILDRLGKFPWGQDARKVANVFVHAIACGQGSPLAVSCAAAVWHLGFRNLVLAIATHRTSAIKAIRVTKGDFAFTKASGRLQVLDAYRVESPCDEDANRVFRKLGGRWDGECWVVPKPQRKNLWKALKECYPAGTLVIGESVAIL